MGRSVTTMVLAPLVVGIDPSLTSAGVVSSTGAVFRVQSKPCGDSILQRHLRLCGLVEQIVALAWDGSRPDLVVLEGPSYASTGGSQHDRAGLWWLLVDALIARGIEPAIAPPKCRAKYASGNGNSSKDACMAAVVRRYPDFEIGNNDAADALALCAMGRDWLGFPLEPMPKVNRMGLDGVSWPMFPRKESY